MELTKSIKVGDDTTVFLKKFRINLLKSGGSEEALELSYAEMMSWVVKYFKANPKQYTEMVEEIAKNV